MLTVFSTLSCDVDYTNYTSGGGDMPVPMPSVKIKGGAGVANDRLVTPLGVATQVTEEQVAYLRQNPVFQMHEKNGFVMISEKRGDADAVAADMSGADGSAPLTVADVSGESDTAVVVGGESVTDEAPKPRGRRKAS